MRKTLALALFLGVFFGPFTAKAFSLPTWLKSYEYYTNEELAAAVLADAKGARFLEFICEDSVLSKVSFDTGYLKMFIRYTYAPAVEGNKRELILQEAFVDEIDDTPDCRATNIGGKLVTTRLTDSLVSCKFSGPPVPSELCCARGSACSDIIQRAIH